MAQIYGSSQTTIIAAAGKSSHYGLPGVSQRRKLSPKQISIGKRRFLLTGSPIERVENSPWNFRGWTFQEAFLSSRCIAFMDEQVYFQCSRTRLCEAMSHLKEDTGSFKTVFPRSLFEHRTGEVHYTDFRGLVSEYTARNLTYDSDILNAFKGVLKALECSDTPLYCA
jgi:heterokaryon incompatibility protein (HET)